MVQLLKGTQDIGFTDGRKIALLSSSPTDCGLRRPSTLTSGLQHQIAPDAAVDIAGDDRHRFIYRLHQPAVESMALPHRPMTRLCRRQFLK